MSLLRPARPTTLRRAIVKALLAPVFIIVPGATAYQVVSATASPEVQREVTVPTYLENLVDLHGCWTGEAPADMAGKFPGHVIVTLPGDNAPTYAGSKVAAEALAHVFGEKVIPGLTVHAFCR